MFIRSGFTYTGDFMGGSCEICLGGLMFVSDASSFSRLFLAQSINTRKSHNSSLKALKVLVKIERGAS